MPLAARNSWNPKIYSSSPLLSAFILILPVTFAGVQLEEDVALAERERRRVGRLETVERLQHGAAALIHY